MQESNTSIRDLDDSPAFVDQITVKGYHDDLSKLCIICSDKLTQDVKIISGSGAYFLTNTKNNGVISNMATIHNINTMINGDTKLEFYIDDSV